jgi:hypothetical protein
MISILRKIASRFVRNADPCLRQAGLSASRARQTAAGKKKRGTPFGMTRSSLFPQIRKALGEIVLAHVEAAVDVEDLAGDVGGFVAGEEDDGGCDVGFGAEAR